MRLYRVSEPKPVRRLLAEQLNVHPEALWNWSRQDQADHGEVDDLPCTVMIKENRRLAREGGAAAGQRDTAGGKHIFRHRD
ncbi:transposase [Rhodococcus qingshengii]|nr:transposase [Rhodococcus qingshengii]